MLAKHLPVPDPLYICTCMLTKHSVWVMVCASVAKLNEAKSKLEEEKTAVEEDRKVQLQLSKAEVSC